LVQNDQKIVLTDTFFFNDLDISSSLLSLDFLLS